MVSSYPRPFEQTSLEKVLLERNRREAEAIRAMQYRARQWMGPVLEILWNKPWKSPSGPHVSLDYTLRVNASNFWSWLTLAHDCSDPSVACSCYGGFRFPKIEDER